MPYIIQYTQGAGGKGKLVWNVAIIKGLVSIHIKDNSSMLSLLNLGCCQELLMLGFVVMNNKSNTARMCKS